MAKVAMKIVFALALLAGLPGTLANATAKVGTTPPARLARDLGWTDFATYCYCATCHGVVRLAEVRSRCLGCRQEGQGRGYP